MSRPGQRNWRTEQLMSTLAVVEQILSETKKPMSVREIVAYANGGLPTRSRTPETVVARDLSMDIKKKGEQSRFIRTAPGRYTMRALHEQLLDAERSSAASNDTATPMTSALIRGERVGTRPARTAADVEGERASNKH